MQDQNETSLNDQLNTEVEQTQKNLDSNVEEATSLEATEEPKSDETVQDETKAEYNSEETASDTVVSESESTEATDGKVKNIECTEENCEECDCKSLEPLIETPFGTINLNAGEFMFSRSAYDIYVIKATNKTVFDNLFNSGKTIGLVDINGVDKSNDQSDEFVIIISK